MKITDIKIDGFGVWRNLSLRGLSTELTVFYGPNEAGKSTLMQFLRSVMYGISPARRERYLPPLEGGRPGGWLKVVGDDGPLTIARYADRGPTDIGKVTVTTADGEEQGDRLLREALEQIDEPTFNNIFAVGLREVQELATLSDTAAAQWLYRLTSGLDRISLYDVIHMLASTRVRLLNSSDEKSEIRTLVDRRDQLRDELEELIVKGRRWAQSAAKLRELADEVDQRQVETKRVEARARRLETAIGVKPLWLKRIKVDDQLEQYTGLQPLGADALDRLDELNKRVEGHERQRDILRGQRHQLRDEAQRLGINETLVANGHRLEALVEQQDWLQGVDRLAAALADEVAQLEKRLTSENERLAHEWTGAGAIPPRITREIVEQLTPQARAMEAAEQMLETTRHELELHRTGEHELRGQIESAMTSGDKLGLPKDIESASDLVAQLRRRQQVEQRLSASRRQADDLQQQGQALVEEQVVPITLFSWLMAVFVLGFMAVGAWWLLPEAWIGRHGGWLAALGIGGAIFAWLFKYFAEDSAADRFDNCHRQLQTVFEQIESAEEEMAQLDRELPMAEGSASMRLAHAERHLAELERMLPVESQRRELEQELSAAERRQKLAQEKYASAVGNWKARLRALGLPDSVSPANLEAMAGQCEKVAELEARIENRQDDRERRQREFEIVSRRIFALAEEAGLRDETLKPIQQLDALVHEHQHQKHRVAQREGLRERAKELKAEELHHAKEAIQHRRRRQALFDKCGVEDEQGLRHLASQIDEADKLRKRRVEITREIAAALGRHGSEQDFASLLAPETIGRLEADWDALTAEQDELDRQLKEAIERRGAMVEQHRTAASDRTLVTKQMELDCVEEQIKRAAVAWRERAAVSLMLERIREDYEAHRQPETLKEASKYMAQITSGKYTRIWTPLANDILFVDNAEGQSLPVQVLSRGTREQLFVSLRLALVAAFARRGIHLPMILDDVFVNFDAGRTKIAAAVLREFAQQGHQLLFITCHEHVWQMFKDLKADARRIPNRHGEAETEEPIQPEPVPEPVVELPPVNVPVPEPLPEPIVAEEPEETYVEVDTELDEPDPIVEEAIEINPIPPRNPDPATPPAGTEVEYWWTQPHHDEWRDFEHASVSNNAWHPEPVVYPERW